MTSTALRLRLRRLHAPHTFPARYGTTDGRFEVSQGAGPGTPWAVIAFTDPDWQRLVLAEADRPFRRLKDAREWLAGSVYAAPYGWLHTPDEQVAADYTALSYRPVADA